MNVQHNFNGWEKALKGLQVGMRMRHWRSELLQPEGVDVVIVGFASPELLGWPVVVETGSDTKITVNPTCLSPITSKRVQGEQEEFF